ncbi:MAG: glycogen debranching protein, partial [Bacteroidota bacterium]|nr:glycogen debranching protein [Bacteroidota bacterium]
SSDRVVWAMAAWEIYTYTGDRNWLESAYQIIRNSVNADARTIRDRKTGLMRGESSFLDWRKQTYPLWMEPADIYASLNLGTNAAHFRVLTILGKMAGELGESNEWTEQAEILRENINKYLWLPDKQYYGQYLYGHGYKTLSPRSEALGEAFCVLFDIASPEQRDAVMNHAPVLDFGIPCIYPQIPNLSSYHNNAIWPFVQAFWTLAAAKEKHAEMVNYGLASMLRQSALFLTNKENYVAGDGDFAGTVINSDRQLWSIAGQLAMTYRVLLGMEFEPGRLVFHPLIPENCQGTYFLDNFHYREGVYSISVDGFGDEISSFKIDGKEDGNHAIPASLTGDHSIVITMTGHINSTPVQLLKNYTAPETPVLSLEENRLSWTPVEKASGYELFRNGEMWQTISSTGIELGEPSGFSEYQVLAVDSQCVQSFKSNPVQVFPDLGQTVLQAESFNLKAEHAVKGFSGKGYVVFSKKNSAELHFSVRVPETGSYRLQFRYANGSGPMNTDNKCGVRSLYVNNNFVCSLVFPQRGKDEWSNWGLTNPENIDLVKGENTFVICFDPSNENMNGEINSFFLDQVMLVKTD